MMYAQRWERSWDKLNLPPLSPLIPEKNPLNQKQNLPGNTRLKLLKKIPAYTGPLNFSRKKRQQKAEPNPHLRKISR